MPFGLSYWFWPLFSAIVWFAGLWAMIIVWLVSGRPHYPSMEDGQTIAYISDVGASNLQPLFITISVIMTVTLDIAFFSERWLRHKRRLTPNYGLGEKIMSALAILFALAGTAGLICLSGPYDTLRHPRRHRTCLAIFLGGYVISAVLICAEYGRLKKHYRHHRILAVGFWMKLAFVFVEVVLAILFGVFLYKGGEAGAILEWALAFIFTFYILTFLVDLLPAVHTTEKHHLDDKMRQTIDDKAGVDGYGQSAMSSNQYDVTPPSDGTAGYEHGASQGSDGYVTPMGEYVATQGGNGYATQLGPYLAEGAPTYQNGAVGNGRVANEGYTNVNAETNYDRMGKQGFQYGRGVSNGTAV